MKRIALLITALLVSLTAFAQVGRYKNINLLYPGYSFKFDTATGELWVVHYENEAEMIMEEEISPKQSHNSRQTGRYEFRRTRHIGTYQIFDTVTGNYTNVKWKPKTKDGTDVDEEIGNAVSTAVDQLRNLLDSTKVKIDSIRMSRHQADTL